MNKIERFSFALALAGALALPLGCNAETKTDAKAGTAKPYPLDKCVVSGEKLGEMGKPYVFTHEGREIKLCCKSCLKDFKKDPAKYVKKIEEAEAKAKK
jgi:YHS domain-containing protein